MKRNCSEEERKRLVEGILTVTAWHGKYGDCLCPLGHEACVYIDDNPAPNLHCHHTRCKDAVKSINAQLSELKGVGRQFAQRLSETEQMENARKQLLQDVGKRAKMFLLPELMNRPKIPPEVWLSESPVRIVPDVREHWRMLLSSLFRPREIVWCGDLTDSGQPFHSTNFRSVENWMRTKYCPGAQTSPAVYWWGSYRRDKKSIQYRPYFIVESDIVPKPEFGIILKWAAQHATLRAIVDTGGKSLHAWFQYPGSDIPAGLDAKKEKRLWERYHAQKEEFYAQLSGLGCDEHMFGIAATTRLPGCERKTDEGERTGKWQRLLYLNPRYPLHLPEKP